MLVCSEDVLHMCQLLNMEEAVDELLEQLDVGRLGRISFSHFMSCRMRLFVELEQDGRFSTEQDLPRSHEPTAGKSELCS